MIDEPRDSFPGLGWSGHDSQGPVNEEQRALLERRHLRLGWWCVAAFALVGLGLETRVRYADAFPVNSGVFNSLGSPPNAAGIALYTRPGTSIQFDLGLTKRLSLAGREFNWSLFGQNIADDQSPTFVGVPAVGRLITTRIQYTF